MPAYAGKLSDEQRDQILSWLREQFGAPSTGSPAH
jgi:mono/diheme cytochrome c family protein